MAEIMDYGYFFEHDVAIERIKWTGSQGIGLCPLPSHDDRRPSFSFNAETGLWTCFGCGEKGNAYQLVKILSIDEPHQYKDWPSYKNGHNGGIRSLKMGNTQEVQVDKMMEIEELKTKYSNNLNQEPLIHGGIEKYVGRDDNGRTVFIYPNAIKHHKNKDGKPPYWNDKSLDKSCQIFMEDELKNFNKNRPLFIFEGEKDALISPSQGISFSGGCGSIPDDISAILVFPTIIIIYDNDEAGSKGAEKLAEKIKKESPQTVVKISQWDKSLPIGYDVYDDRSTGFEKVDEAIVNAKEYNLPIPTLKGFKIMTGTEASNTTPKPTEWIVENILPKGFNSCLAGTTGSKKSMWAMQLALSVANGEKQFCGNTVRTSGIKVLYIDTEIGEDECVRRFHRIKKHMDWKRNENWIMMCKGGTNMDIWEQTEEMIQSYRPELVVIDSMYNATSVTDFSKSTAMSKVTDALSIIKDRFNVTILVIAQFNKGGHELGLTIDRMQGSAVLQNWIEFQMLMVKTNEQDLNIWKVAKTRGVYHDDSYVGLKWDDFWFTAKGVIEDIKPYLVTEEKKRKWTTILEDCPQRFDTNQWLNVFTTKYPDMSERTAKTWLKEASGTPMVKRISHGAYKKNLELIDENNIG